MYYIVVFSFVGLMYFRSRVMRLALSNLDGNHKTLLVDLFSSNKRYSYILVVIVFVLLYFVFYSKVIREELFLIISLCLIMAYVSIRSYFFFNKLKENNFPKSYINAYLQSTGVTLAGFLVLLLSINFLK